MRTLFVNSDLEWVLARALHLCIWYWVELLKNGLIDIMYLIISRTENNVTQEVLVVLSSWVANSWIDSIN